MRGKSKAVAEELRGRIASGQYPPGAQLPRVRDLMAEFGVRSLTTIDRALKELTTEGLLTVTHGSGIYVRVRQVVTRDLVGGLRLEYRIAHGQEAAGGGIFEAVTGLDPGAVDVATEYRRRPAPVRAAQLLTCPDGTEVLERTFTVSINGRPHQQSRSYLTATTADLAGLVDPSRERPGVTTIAQLLAADIVIDRVYLVIEARMPTAEEREVLAIPTGTPVHEVWRVMSTADGPVEASVTVVSGDQVAYVATANLGDPA